MIWIRLRRNITIGIPNLFFFSTKVAYPTMMTSSAKIVPWQPSVRLLYFDIRLCLGAPLSHSLEAQKGKWGGVATWFSPSCSIPLFFPCVNPAESEKWSAAPSEKPLSQSRDAVNSVNCSVWLLGVIRLGLDSQTEPFELQLLSVSLLESVVCVSECVFGNVFVLKEILHEA